MTQNPKNKNLPAPEIDVRNQSTLVMANVEDDARANPVGTPKSLPQVLKARPIRAPRDSVPRVQRGRPLGMIGRRIPNLFPAQDSH
jgi:hypothetical protein